MDAARPKASAISVLGETIVSVGQDAAVLAEAGPSTVLVDLGGRTMMPGFVDSHSHMFAEPDKSAVQETLLRIGVTTTSEMYVDEARLQDLLDLEASGGLRLRLSAYMVYNTNCGDPLDEWWRSYPPTRTAGEFLRIGGIKIFSDGGSCHVPAVTFEYPGGNGQGDLFLTQEEMEAALRTVDAAGYQAAVHALGDRALDAVLGAFEAVFGGSNNRRHRIEHNAVIRPDQLSRYSLAQPVVTIFAPFPTCNKLGAPTTFKYIVPEANRSWEWPWRALIDANPGLHIAWHGDMPHVFPADAAYQLFALVTRAQVAVDGSICQPPDWIAQNAVSLEEALHLMTLGAAYALDRDQEVGSLEPGKYADLIILSDDPAAIPPLELRNLQVLLTMVGGRVEYCAEGMQALCPAQTAEPTLESPAGGGFRDEFDGQVPGEGWTWIRENPNLWSLSEQPGFLTLSTGNGSLLRAGGTAPILLRPAPSGDFEVQTRLQLSPSQNFQFAGILIYRDDDHFVALGRAYCGFIPPCVGDGAYLDNDEEVVAGEILTVAAAGLPSGEPIHLRLVRQGETYTGYWSSDGESWTEVGVTSASFTPQSIGLFAANSATGAASIPVGFDFIEIR
jgi:predicted amidohydrolase YtcJ/regulation of enolase protein 1 (concanavalin A-like superfamily)